VIEHLAVSTVVLAVALAAARFLPLTARTRYAVLCLGLVKFAIPTAIFRIVPAEAVPAQLRIFGGAPAATAVQSATSVDWLLASWVAVAMLVLGRWLLLRKRTIDAALRSPAPPSARELTALRDANVAADLIRSPLCDAPAVLRVIRPVIVIPAGGCDDLDDDELRSLLLHEGAHIARRDNLATFAQALATSLLWFHPLVWIASRAISAAREEACDEVVADRMRETDAYVSALDKLCHAIASPRTAGASCMAGANVKERIHHLMRYDTIKHKAWPHRAILVLAFIGISLSTIAATNVVTKRQPYTLNFTVGGEGKELIFDFHVRQGDKFQFQRGLRTAPGEPATLRYGMDDGHQETEFLIETTGTRDKGEVRFEVKENGTVVQAQTLTYDHSGRRQTFDGQPLSLDLKGAAIRDVMDTFEELTGLEIVVAEDVQATVTMKAHNMPWDQVLDTIARDNGLRMTLEGKKILVSKQ
jgi:beta-lactamase regulating signal transducer with metallopeptidase domain